MKKLVFALITAAAMNVSASQYVTVEVCNGGESGVECRMVTYKVRPPSAPIEEGCTTPVGEAGYAPCNENAKVPAWLAKLNKFLSDAGFEPAEQVEAP